MSTWAAFAAGFFLSQFIRWLLDTTFGPRGEVDRRYPPANRVRWSSSDPRWHPQSHDSDPSIIRLDDHRRGTTQTPERGRGA